MTHALPLNGGLNEDPHPILNEIPNGGRTSRVQVLEQANLQHLIEDEGMPLPSQIVPHPQNIISPHGAPPPPNPIAPANGSTHHEALEEESSHHPLPEPNTN